LFEVSQLVAGFEPQFVGERSPRLLVSAQSLCLPPRSVEGEHQLSAQALAVGVLGDERLEFADQLAMATEREVGLEPLFEGRDTSLVETCAGGNREAL
jgi:hypothetical protein